MFEEIRNKRIASFCLGDEYIGIVPSEMIKSANSYSKKIGELSIVVHFAEVAHNFYYWTVFLKNNGRVNTEQITNFYGMDIDIPVSGKTLWQSIRGDDCNGDSFMPLSEELHEDSVILHEAVEGRSSQHTAFPYFDITSDCGSAVFAVGWTGQWSYILTRTDNNLSLKAGFTDFDLYLAPGESVRSVGDRKSVV